MDKRFTRTINIMVLVVVLLLAATMLYDALSHQGGCNPGPKPPAWSPAQYHRYLRTAC